AWFRVSYSSPLLGGYDEPETLSYQIDLNCPIGADVRQMAMNCGYCGTEIKEGYTACSACGAVLCRPPLMSMVIGLFLWVMALGAFSLIGMSVRDAIEPYSTLIANVFGIIVLSIFPLAALWFVVKRSFQRRWYKMSALR
ncbi:hypothetical protein ABLN87_21275, partial [Ruegeria sp. SCPT10]|uniref:hypothetical protein n=1 Tax=Ruegeria sp. SCP10 TaxID=3141377 RepID=UPI00333731CF